MFQSFSHTRRISHRCFSFLVVVVALFCIGSSCQGDPVEFEFKIAPSAQNPFAREIWAEVAVPSGKVIKLPAFYAGKDRYAVRARADVKGLYHLGPITEVNAAAEAELAVTVRGSRERAVQEPEPASAVMIDPKCPDSFALVSGRRFVPIGANLAWADKRRIGFYRAAFDAFAQNKLNWTRVWMVHWSGLNLDWLPRDMGKSPRDGILDLRVAKNWDRLLAMAEEKGVYVQMVLQHHGQYSSQVNPNWKDNPWNVANGGFLKTATEFFTSPEAIRLTKQKYRYIVARWGYSPAVMAWELFNEVHWVDAMRGENKDEAAVVRWHVEMAAYLRSLDRYGHLVTTSTDDLRNPLCEDMDFLQPHLYAPDLIPSVRRFEFDQNASEKPIFYGEVGDDHLSVSDDEKKTGVTIVPPVWASLMGLGRIPAQPWLGADLLTKGRIAELGAVSEFLGKTGLFTRETLTAYSPALECAEQMPLVLHGGYIWGKRPSPELSLPLDGRTSIDFGRIPRIFMNGEESRVNGQSSRAVYHFNFPRASVLQFHIGDSAASNSAIRILLDEAVAAEAAWPELPKEAPPKSPRPQQDILVPVTAGEHTLVVENPADKGWFDLTAIDVGLEQPVLAAIGQRNADFIALWVWHRRGVFASKGALPVAGTLLVDNLPAGSWRVTWWDTFTGQPAAPVSLSHPGGLLRLPTPAIGRHAAVVIERLSK